MDNYVCSIKTISPVHIGSGKEYNKSEYVLDEMKFKSKNKTSHKKVIKRIDISKFYSGLSDDKKDEFINILSQPNSNLTDFEPNIKKKFLKYYSFNNSTVDPRDIKEHIKTLDEMYIPGSSIKGAIKTALFYSKLRQEDIYRIEELFSDGGKVKLNTRAYNSFIDSFFSANRGNAAQKSIMKFLQISDTSTLKTPTVYDVLTIKATDNGRVIFHSRNNKAVYNYLETIRSNRKLTCNFGINYDEKVINNLKLNDKKNLIRLDTIKKAIYDFSKDLIDYELIFSENYNVPYLNKFYKEINKLNSIDKPLLRVGFGSSFMATTIGMFIKEMDSYLFDKVGRTAPKYYPYEFPKSRKIIKKGGMPLGWIQLDFNKEVK